MRRYAAVVGVSLAVTLPACERDEIRAYEAPKDAREPATTVAAPSAPVAPGSMAAPAVVWTIPEGWSESTKERRMRVATFFAGPDGDIEVALTAFPGDVGGMLANVNRWRGQMGLAPVDEAGLAEDVRILDHEGVPVAIVDLVGADGLRMLGAIVEPGDGQTWFVKATAESEALDAIESEFVDFARTIRMGDTVSSGSVDAGLESTRPAPDEMEGRLANWTPPEDWSVEEGASPILSASYLTDGGARITVTRLRGDGGGDLANVNRWRGQLGLGPAETLDETAGVVDESPLVVDLRAPGEAGRMIAAIVPDTGITMYFKMTGQPEAVEAARPGFDRLVAFVGLGETAGEGAP